ncbi:ABC transporter substrate-binding protein [Thermocoleostomius sinensis]|uniref:ABC transporter substrate-binding protein n=1 Tax=Thermocoleostomius sinensis A174 TaxID=2016057 RepID=A0A9E8Z9A1_9CYAN|nr:ABC transporter substrate-binding protein [Thermocoleostomius sinensis]WAL58642.1 ABC transporter substrate-binding protein [Thermocoleostomius sinensis A174]
MSQKNETPVLLLSLLITLALIGGGLWWLGRRLNINPLPDITQSNGTEARIPATLQDRFSTGERLLTQTASRDKEAGVTAIANQNYNEAVRAFEASLRETRNDPEALVYLNNARIAEQPAYTIAVSVPLATSIEPALEILRGVAQAQEEVNQQGGINGVPLRVLIISDDNNVETVRQVAESLVQNESVLGVVGHFGSEATLAGAEIYNQQGLVMISPTSTSVQLSGQGNYTFRTVPSDRFTATALASYLLDETGEQAAVVYYNAGSDYSTSLKNQFTTALTTGGGQVVEEVDVSDASFNADRSLTQAAQRGAQALVLTTNTPTLDQALQVIRANNRQLPLLGGDSLYNPRVLEVGQADAEGMVVAVPWIISSNLQSPFVQSSQSLWGGDVNWRTAMAYDAAAVLIEGLRQNPTREGLRQALSDPSFEVEGATGMVRFLSSGDRNQPMQLTVIQPGTRSGYGFDFVPVR